MSLNACLADEFLAQADEGVGDVSEALGRRAGAARRQFARFSALGIAQSECAQQPAENAAAQHVPSLDHTTL